MAALFLCSILYLWIFKNKSAIMEKKSNKSNKKNAAPAETQEVTENAVKELQIDDNITIQHGPDQIEGYVTAITEEGCIACFETLPEDNQIHPVKASDVIKVNGLEIVRDTEEESPAQQDTPPAVDAPKMDLPERDGRGRLIRYAPSKQK